MTTNYSKSQIFAWLAWIIASIFYAYQYVLRVLPNIMLSDIMQQFQIDAATFGQFSGIYYIGYSLMHLPLGILLDRFGPRKVMTLCILLSVVGLLPLIFASHWMYPIFGRLLIGMGSSGAILGVFKIIRMTFAEKRFSRMLSFSVTIGLIGAIYGGGPVSCLCESLGYQKVLRLFALSGVILAAITYWIIPNMNSSSKDTVLSNIKEVFTNSRVILSCIFAGLLVGPLEGFADVWGTSFLKETYGLHSTVAASLLSMIFIGMCFGSPVLSFIAEKTKSTLLTIVGAGAVMAISFVLLLAWKLQTGFLSINFVIVGVCCAYQILAIYKASTFVSEQVAGLTTAVANMIIMTFGYAFHSIIGGIIQIAGGPDSSTAFFYGIAVIPVTLCIGTLGYVYLYVREKKAKALTLKV